jgi:hypothetical protein
MQQLPLKGFHAEQPKAPDGWKSTIEGMGDGRYRVHMTKIKK